MPAAQILRCGRLRNIADDIEIFSNVEVADVTTLVQGSVGTGARQPPRYRQRLTRR